MFTKQYRKAFANLNCPDPVVKKGAAIGRGPKPTQAPPKASKYDIAPGHHRSLDGSIRLNFPGEDGIPKVWTDKEAAEFYNDPENLSLGANVRMRMALNNPTLVLGDPDDEILATILRGLLSKTNDWSIRKVTFPETGRVGWLFSIDSFVLMDSKYKDAIEEVFPSYTGKSQ